MKLLIRTPLRTSTAMLLATLLSLHGAAAERPSRVLGTQDPSVLRLAPKGPPPAELVGPPPAIVLTTPNVRFQWRAGAGLTGIARYEICVRPLDRPCTDPDALAIRPTGTLLTESPIPVIKIDPITGNKTYEQPAGTADGGTPPFFYAASLPIRMQGRRLSWSITTCVPANQQLYSATTPTELCTESTVRPLTYPLPMPVPQSPNDHAVLPAPLRPTFVWSVANPQGIDRYLLCLSFPGVACPTAPTAQPQVVVGPVTGATQVTPEAGFFSALMGKSLRWSVTACNAELGCTPYATARSFTVPILDGTFDAIYAVTQHEKCTNCHHMRKGNATYQRHVALGRIPPAENPRESLRTLVDLPRTLEEEIHGLRPRQTSICFQCHTAALGFVDGWQAPTVERDFDVPISTQFCELLKVEPVLSRGGIGHLRDDAQILWGVARIAGLGVPRWQQSIDKWSAAGAPCPTAWQGQFPTR